MFFTESQPTKPQDKLKQLLAETPGLWRGNQREHGDNLQSGRQSSAQLPSIQISGDLFAVPEPIVAREQRPAPTQSSGFSDLDQLLPGGGLACERSGRNHQQTQSDRGVAVIDATAALAQSPATILVVDNTTLQVAWPGTGSVRGKYPQQFCDSGSNSLQPCLVEH